LPLTSIPYCTLSLLPREQRAALAESALQTIQQLQRQNAASLSNTSRGEEIAPIEDSACQEAQISRHQSPPPVPGQSHSLHLRVTKLSRKRSAPSVGDNPDEPYGYADWGCERFKAIDDRSSGRPQWSEEETNWILEWCSRMKKDLTTINSEEMRQCLVDISLSEEARSIFHPHHVYRVDRIAHVFKQFKKAPKN
jgi:hypothetical protein